MCLELFKFQNVKHLNQLFSCIVSCCSCIFISLQNFFVFTKKTEKTENINNQRSLRDHDYFACLLKYFEEVCIPFILICLKACLRRKDHECFLFEQIMMQDHS